MNLQKRIPFAFITFFALLTVMSGLSAFGCTAASSPPDPAVGGMESGDASQKSDASTNDGDGGALADGSPTERSLDGGASMPPFAPLDTFSAQGNGWATVLFADYAGACRPSYKRSSRIFVVKVETQSGSLILGDYPIDNGPNPPNAYAWATDFDLGPACNAKSTDGALGTVTITAISPGAVEGHYTMQLDGKTIQDSFVAPTCATPPNAEKPEDACAP
jgi:hypothetical protein